MDPTSGAASGATAALDIVNSGLDRAAAAKQERRDLENKALNESRDLFDWGRQRESARAQRNIQANTGQYNPLDYLSDSMLGQQELSAPQQEAAKGMSGYNAAVDLNPMMRSTPGMAQYMDNVKATGEQMSGDMSEAYARQQSALTEGLRGSNEKYGELRDADQAYSNEQYDRLDQSEQGDLARLVVESWINSNSADSAGDQFVDARRGGRGKVRGADEAGKREYVSNQAARGVSYEEMLQDPRIMRYISQDPNAAPLLAEYERFA